MDYANRPARGRQAKPTKAEVSVAWSCIRTAAQRGDLQASVFLIALSEGRPIFHLDGGILNLPGHSGWRGDDKDPQGVILDAIRQNNPQSKQLPENQ